MNPQDIQPQLENFKPAAAVYNTTSLVNKSFLFNIGNMEIAPTYWQAGLIVFLLFILIFTFARLRRLYVGWSLKSFLPAVGLGFLLALVFEGFMILGGKTLLIELMGWENAPKPISTALDEGRTELIKVLGVTEEISETDRIFDYREVISSYESLSEEDRQKATEYICTPE
jgi:hypothetical protein